MRIRWLHVFLAMVVVGCERSPSSTGNGAAESRPQGEVVSIEGSQREQIEKVLARSIRDVPIGRRYFAVSQKADDLWRLIDGLSSNDTEYVILVTARLQQELESEMREIEITRKTVDVGPLYISKDGTRYHRAMREVAEKAAKEARSIGEAQEYRKQLEHFLSRYPNRLDSPFMKVLFGKLPPDTQSRLRKKIIEVLGRPPKW